VSFVRYFDEDYWDSSGWVDTMLGLVDSNRGGKPVWIIESGWPGSTSDDQLDKSRNLVRSVVIFWNRPFMERYFWYQFQADGTFGGPYHRGLIESLNGSASKGVEPDPLFHPAYRAAEVMSRVLAGFDYDDRPAVVDVGASARAYKFASGGREVWVVWSRDHVNNTVITLDTGGKTTRVIGLYGEDLGLFGGGGITATPLPTYLTSDLAWNAHVGRITGRVRDGDLPNQWGNGLFGLMVTAVGPVSTSVATDADGNYSLDYLPEGTYAVGVPGYATTPASLQVNVVRDGAWGRSSFVVN
jgi:hypothetical protein